MKIQSALALFFSLAIAPCKAFVPVSSSVAMHLSSSALAAESEKSFLDTIQTTFDIAKESNAAGYGLKQVIADVLAGGDYDKEAISASIEDTIASAPCGK